MANHRKHSKRSTELYDKEGRQKAVIKKYHVSAQTAYHIMELALMENTTEGRIVDKLMRTYLASRSYR